jgi:glycosyltransferase involved in cell wall biosynthesis
MALALRAVHPEFRVRHVEWSLRARADAIAGADLVVLPQDAASMWGTVKSHNRLVEAIRGGRFAIAPPVPAYVELSEYSRIGDDLANAIEWALGHPDEVLSRLDAGQAYVAQRFSPERIGAQWARVLGL